MGYIEKERSVARELIICTEFDEKNKPYPVL